MRRSHLAVGNVVRVRLDACRQPFDARITNFSKPGCADIEPLDSWPTWRLVSLGDITERIDPPVRRRRKAAA